MGQHTNFLGCYTVRIILNNADKTINKFKARNSSTKLALIDKLQVENEIYRNGTTILIDNLEVQAQNKVNNQAIKKYEQEFEVRNDDFINKHKISIVTSKERKHARTALLNYLKHINTQILK